VSPPFDTDLSMTPILLINTSLQTATHFLSAGNFQMRLAAHLLLMKCREQRDITDTKRGFNGKPRKRQKACAATSTQ
jgi:hypothetical protein